MEISEIASPPQILAGRNDKQEKLNWQESLPIQRLLDVISSILAEEYIMIAKQNPEVFTEIGRTQLGSALPRTLRPRSLRPSEARNDTLTEKIAMTNFNGGKI